VTQVTAPTLRNDMHGAFLARSLGARTIAFGTHVTSIPRETMRAFPGLDFVPRGETKETIQKTIRFAKRLPLDLALFHIAAPYPGSPLFFDVVEQGWFRPGTRWEQVDMDCSTVLDYPHLRAEELERWAQRAFRAWALRPGPVLTYLRMLLGSPSLWRPALEIGLESLGWAASG
jgi:radical SAM superfamily enzyme YgiQ (UPF0313 family)